MIIPFPKPMAVIGQKKFAILETKSEHVDEITDDIKLLARKLLTTCIKKDGHAIAAVQVGIPINLVVTATGEAFVNVGVSTTGKKKEDGIEGCLSIPGRYYNVPRFKKAEFSGTNVETGEFLFKKVDGFEARLWQHEYEHLQGQLISELYPEVNKALIEDSELL